MLEELGYRVMQAANGHEALHRLEENPDLEVMVTDIRMPGMSGLELSDVAGERHRDLKIILISGYFLPQPIQRRFLQSRSARTISMLPSKRNCTPIISADSRSLKAARRVTAAR